MTNTPDHHLISSVVRTLGLGTKVNVTDLTLKSICRACGVNRVLLKLPDIFTRDDQFFFKVLTTYRKKIQIKDCLDVIDQKEVKEAVQQKFTSSELAELLSKKLQEEEEQGITTQLTKLDVHQMLKRIPRDVVISQTVANDELISSKVVLEIALQNSRESDTVETIQSQHPSIANKIARQVWTQQTVTAPHVIYNAQSKEQIISVIKSLNASLSVEELTDIFSESIKEKCRVNFKSESDGCH